MEFEIKGDFPVKLEREKVMRFFLDHNKFINCIPDLESYETIDEKTFKARIKLELSFLKTKFDSLIKIEKISDNRISYSIDSKTIGSEVKINLIIEILENKVIYNAKILLKGIITGLSENIIKSFTNKKIEELIKNINAYLKNF